MLHNLWDRAFGVIYTKRTLFRSPTVVQISQFDLSQDMLFRRAECSEESGQCETIFGKGLWV